MIRVLTPNPALDLTYTVPSPVRDHHEHRVREVHEAAGGKGVNVARVLAALGENVTVTGPLGGTTGEELAALLAQEPGVHQDWIPISGSTRRTVTAVDQEGATGFNEPGPRLTTAEVRDVCAAVSPSRQDPTSEDRADVVVISGSLPPGLDPEALVDLVADLHEHGIPVVVDTSGPALPILARAGADLLKPNAAEAQQATGTSDPLAAADALLTLGARRVLCSLGADGMLAAEMSADGDPRTGRALRVRPARALAGNPTGAGDAAVASLARSLRRGEEIAEAVASAVALSASAVTMPLAGQVDPDLAARLRPTLTVQEIR
jgi:tagatose 6-phosphate kinase